MLEWRIFRTNRSPLYASALSNLVRFHRFFEEFACLETHIVKYRSLAFRSLPRDVSPMLFLSGRHDAMFRGTRSNGSSLLSDVAIVWARLRITASVGPFCRAHRAAMRA